MVFDLNVQKHYNCSSLKFVSTKQETQFIAVSNSITMVKQSTHFPLAALTRPMRALNFQNGVTAYKNVRPVWK